MKPKILIAIIKNCGDQKFVLCLYLDTFAFAPLTGRKIAM